MFQDKVILGPSMNSEVSKQSLGQIFYNSLKNKDPKDMLFIDSTMDKYISREELFKSSVILSLNLSSKLKIGKDSVITIIAPSSWKSPVIVLATLFNGAKLHSIYPESTQWELQQSFMQCKPDVIFCTVQHLEDNLELRTKGIWSGQIVLLDGDTHGNDTTSFEELLTGRTVKEIDKFYPQHVDCQQTAVIFRSSGTTGIPKMINLTHYNLTMFFIHMKHPNYLGIEKGDKTIGYLPLAHIFGFMVLLIYIYFDGIMIFLPKFQPEHFLQIIDNFKITKLFATPSIIRFMLDSPLVSRYDISSIDDVVTGSDGLTLQNWIKANELFGIEIRPTYGMTESTSAITMTPKNSKKFGTIGKLTPNMQAQIRDIKTGKPLGPNEAGEIYVRGPTVFKEGLQEDGFFKTGDIGYYDDEEFFYFVDRLKEIIKCKGFQVSPRELEKLLEEHPAVKEAAVIGKPDERCGEVPAAFVVKQPGQDVYEEELLHYIDEKVAPHKRLNGGVKFVDEILKNKMGKKVKNQLKELL